MRLYIGILFFFYGTQVFGELRVPAIFCDFMVLQRDSGNPIWGWADPHESQQPFDDQSSQGPPGPLPRNRRAPCQRPRAALAVLISAAGGNPLEPWGQLLVLQPPRIPACRGNDPIDKRLRIESSSVALRIIHGRLWGINEFIAPHHPLVSKGSSIS